MMTGEQDLTQRIERLETQNRRMRVAGLAVVIAAVAAVLMGQGAPQSQPTKRRVVEAEEFRLVGKDGNTRGLWHVYWDGTVKLSLTDKDEETRAGLAVHADGASGLAVWDKGEVVRAALHLSAEGWARLFLADKEGYHRIAMTINPDDLPALAMYDEDEKCRIVTGIGPDGLPGLTMYDKDRTARAALGTAELATTKKGAKTKTTESSLVLYDKEGKAIFQAP